MLAVGHHDHVHVALRAVAQHFAEQFEVGVGHEKPPRPLVDLAEPLAGFANGRGVYDRHRLGDMVAQHPIKQSLVAILQPAQIDVLVEILTVRREFVPAMLRLLSKGLLGGWQQT
jgi:hypothetical protein